MSKIFNQQAYPENGQFAGGQAVTASAGLLPFVAGGLYVGTIGDVSVQTIDGSEFTLVNISGFVPGLITRITAATASNIIALK
jgi:hypothetical protein